MQLIIPNAWNWFCVLLGVVLLTSLIMGRLSRQFVTRDVVLRSFSIMDLEWPATPLEVFNLVKGIDALPVGQPERVRGALRSQLYVDFLFMPGAYGALFLVCMQVSLKMPVTGAVFFSVLAWLQLVSWCCDIVENFFLLRKTGPNPVLMSRSVFKAYRVLEILKWGFSLTGLVCGLSGLLYFWLSGGYVYDSLHFLLIIAAEIALFVVLRLVYP